MDGAPHSLHSCQALKARFKAYTIQYDALIMAHKFIQTGRKIVAVARNYAKHARELNNPVPQAPMIFLKPTSSYIVEGNDIIVPDTCTELHHEVELGVIISRTCSHVTSDEAMSYIGGYCLALDMTARELQSVAKKAGHPWTVSKGYDTFCPVSEFIAEDRVKDPHDVELWLDVDGQQRQKSSTNMMLFRLPQLISHVSDIMTLEAGDVILTGTPEGVGPVKPGQTINAGITGIASMSFRVAAASRSKL